MPELTACHQDPDDVLGLVGRGCRNTAAPPRTHCRPATTLVFLSSPSRGPLPSHGAFATQLHRGKAPERRRPSPWHRRLAFPVRPQLESIRRQPLPLQLDLVLRLHVTRCDVIDKKPASRRHAFSALTLTAEDCLDGRVDRFPCQRRESDALEVKTGESRLCPMPNRNLGITNRCSRPLKLWARTAALHGNSAAATLMRRGC